MATSQYIGARYVPKFYQNSVDGSTQWEANVVYDPLVYVTLQNGHMYISKKQVPATIGTPASNVDYWLDVGSFNGFIEELQNQIDEINDVTIPAINAELSILDNIAQLKGKKIAIYGSSNEVDGYSGGDNWVTYMSNILDGYATVINKSVGGEWVTHQIDNFINDASHNTYDIVIFCCTKNLFYDQNRLDIGSMWGGDWSQGRLYNKIMSLKSHRTMGQKIYFASMTPYADDFKNIPMCIYDGIIKRACENAGFFMLDMHSWLGFGNSETSNYTSDDRHFVNALMPIWASRCIQGLLNINEPFENYSCTLKDDDVYTYAPFTFLNGVIRDTQGYKDILKMDTNLSIKMVLHLKNTTGSDITVGTTIMTIDNTNYPWFARPLSLHSSEDFSNFGASIKFKNGSYQIIVTDGTIPNNATFEVCWGNIDSQLDLMYV